jgi:preprotein translocase subunit SecB
MYVFASGKSTADAGPDETVFWQLKPGPAGDTRPTSSAGRMNVMAEDPKPAQPVAPPRLRVLNQYIRDLSFENVAALKGTVSDAKPEITVQVGIDAEKKTGDNYEVRQKIKVEAKAAGSAIFILEMDFAGVFEVANVPAEQMHPFLLVECPRLVFPYLRRIVGDVTRDGGYPPLNLDNIDYLNLYRQEIARRQAMQEAKTATIS